ncbi:MAG: sporulation protein YunB [Oscillospiraceae bacterium]|nr:sporulation protein YunB [Oscillospiraceae bacterium]
MKTSTKTEKNAKIRFGKALVLIGLLLFALGLYAELRVRPLIERTGEYQIQVAAVRAINDSVLTELLSPDYDYSALINLSFNSDGEVKSITSDTNTINRLKARSGLVVNEAVGGLPDKDIGIPFGTVSGVALLYGRGPIIPVKIMPRGFANTVLISEFTSAGINQTLHRIIMEIEVDLAVIIPGYNKTMTVTTNYIVAETVIVGEVPHAYTRIITGDGDLLLPQIGAA